MKGKCWKNGALLWLGLVGFLLIVPPFLPMALLSGRPWFYSSIAMGYALLFGTVIWMFWNAIERRERRDE